MFIKNKQQYLAVLLGLVLSSCSNVQTESKAPVEKDDKRKLGFGSIAGEDFLTFGGPKKQGSSAPNATVNKYLWKASLQTLEFMPLASVDAVGGVVVTDWYTSAQAPKEKLKVSVYIYGNVLRTDAVKVVVYKQIQNATGAWVQAATDEKIGVDLENIILSKARQLKIQDSKS